MDKKQDNTKPETKIPDDASITTYIEHIKIVDVVSGKVIMDKRV